MEIKIEILFTYLPPKNLIKLNLGLSWSLTLLYRRSSFNSNLAIIVNCIFLAANRAAQ